MFGQNDDNQQSNIQEPTTVQPTTTAESATPAFVPPATVPTVTTPDDTATGVIPESNSASFNADSLELPDTPALPGNLTSSGAVTDDSDAPEPPTTAPPSVDSDEDVTPDVSTIDTDEDDENDNDDNDINDKQPSNKKETSVDELPTIPTEPNELVGIKQEALEELAPLVEHLDQTPEERFRTTMMMIQATDDSTKIRDAYDAAQKIEDKKIRAQALLDVINEINYFNQQAQDKVD